MTNRERTYVIVSIASLVIAILSCLGGWLALPQIQRFLSTNATSPRAALETDREPTVPVFTPIAVIPTVQPNTDVPSTPTKTSVPTAPPRTTACAKWDLAADFQVWPKQENPNRDSCGNLGVWHFMSSSSLKRNPSTYYLLPEFVPADNGIVGHLKWRNPNAQYAGLMFNATANTYQSWPPKTIWVHTDSSKLIIIGWRSPMDGKVKATGSVLDIDPSCGDGISWYIGVGSTDIAGGSIDNGAGQQFQNGLGGSNLSDISVRQGDFIYLAIDPKGGDNCDATLVYYTISK